MLREGDRDPMPARWAYEAQQMRLPNGLVVGSPRLGHVQCTRTKWRLAHRRPAYRARLEARHRDLRIKAQWADRAMPPLLAASFAARPAVRP